MHTFNSTIKFLYGLQKYGMKFGLENIKKLCESLENPHQDYPTIHIAGTNGKGSTSAMIASVLTASGYKTGLYTSPHLLKFNERIRIDGKPISNKELVSYTKMVRDEVKKTSATFFETTTAIAFKYFSDQKIDIAVIETGLGGRLDATNIITPLISIITNIGLEHTEYLGSTTSKIAREKAGIIKPFVPCLTAVRDEDAFGVIQSVARKSKSTLKHIDDNTKLVFVKNDLQAQYVDIKVGNTKLNNLKITMPGKFQKDNIRLSILAVTFLREEFSYKITDQSIRCGFADVKKFSGLRGRFDLLSNNPLIIGDVAHNTQAFINLKATLFRLGIYKVIVVFGLMKDKDLNTIVQEIGDFARIVITCSPITDRAIPSGRIASKFKSSNIPCIDGKTPKNSLKIAKNYANSKEIILITGSHYVLGEAMSFVDS
ncbi:MAG: folylpolyglutamate synthase/dihydrofolate synthase family protein [Bacteroidota bacterium]|nr:folylpolyglutamate synthase/dihydrofolate synthase family protein [Bacteroidota bacterium]